MTLKLPDSRGTLIIVPLSSKTPTVFYTLSSGSFQVTLLCVLESYNPLQIPLGSSRRPKTHQADVLGMPGYDFTENSGIYIINYAEAEII